jgi:glutamate-1-semialdehyde 2,1-aminomutase
MAAGIATLGYLIEHQGAVYKQLEDVTRQIAEGLAAIAQSRGIALTTNRIGSMFTWFFTDQPVTDFSSAATSDTAAFARFHRAMMDHGVWLPPSQFEAAFVGMAHGEREVALLLEAAKASVA